MYYRNSKVNILVLFLHVNKVGSTSYPAQPGGRLLRILKSPVIMQPPDTKLAALATQHNMAVDF
jgi:hypothetical protein